MKIAIP